MQALWMLLASLLFATMGVCIKFASAHFSSFEVVFYRGLIGLSVLAGFGGVALMLRPTVASDQLLGWLGLALIIASGSTATLLRARTAPKTPPKDHSG